METDAPNRPERTPHATGATYALERELGSGGMATVYLARDTKHGRRVAIKVLHPELAAVLGTERFLREIRVIATLQHPHIVGLIDSRRTADMVVRLLGEVARTQASFVIVDLTGVLCSRLSG